MSLLIQECFFHKLSFFIWLLAKTICAGSSGEVLLDQSSPYFVHPSDGPSSVMVTPVLNGSNYHSWARSMRSALGGKMKFEFINGTIPQITDFFIILFMLGIVTTC